MLRDALRAAPDSINVNIEQVGQYHPEERDFLSLLTDRQREVFEHAVRVGYYEIPRGANQEELAAALGCAPSTVDEHLRKAESRMLSALVNAPRSD
jgi:predicted DNA binding protein